MSRILDDLDFFAECIDKGQWFIIWKQNWATLFEHRPEWIKYFPKDLWDDEHWHAAVKVLPELAAQCPLELKEKLPVQQKNVFVWDSAEKDEKVEYVNIANLQENADNGDMTALFLTGYLQFPPDWEIMMKAACFGDSEVLSAYSQHYGTDFAENLIAHEFGHNMYSRLGGDESSRIGNEAFADYAAGLYAGSRGLDPKGMEEFLSDNPGDGQMYPTNRSELFMEGYEDAQNYTWKDFQDIVDDPTFNLEDKMHEIAGRYA